MDKSKFTLIPGGLPDIDPASSRGDKASNSIDMIPNEIRGADIHSAHHPRWSGKNLRFHSAWATNSRLMGVLCVSLCWDLRTEKNQHKLHQFFYFDCSEYGFDRFEYLIGSQKAELENLKASLIGGLGAEKVPLSFPEALSIIQYYIQFNQKRNITLPEGEEEYLFLLDLPSKLSEPDRYRLFRRLCVHLESRMDLTNYFMMRYCDRDSAGLRYLSDDAIDSDQLDIAGDRTLYANDLKISRDQKSCAMRSLVSGDQEYYLVNSSLTYRGQYVKTFQVENCMHITPTEAYFILSHPEFITVYDYRGPSRYFRRSLSRLTRNAMILDSNQGRTFMYFRPDNLHVNSTSYRLYQDTAGLMHLRGDKQVICSGNSEADIHALEVDLIHSPAYPFLEPIGSFQFSEPVMIQFLQSGYEDFRDFLFDMQNE